MNVDNDTFMVAFLRIKKNRDKFTIEDVIDYIKDNQPDITQTVKGVKKLRRELVLEEVMLYLDNAAKLLKNM